SEAQAKWRLSEESIQKSIEENVFKPSDARAAEAVKLQEQQEKILNGQADFLKKYIGLEGLAKATINPGKTIPQGVPDLKAEQALKDKIMLEQLLNEFQTYQDKRNAIVKKANESVALLQQAGFKRQAEIARQRYDSDLADLDEKQFKSLESYRSLFDNLETVSKDYSLLAITYVEEELKNFEGSAKAKIRITKE